MSVLRNLLVIIRLAVRKRIFIQPVRKALAVFCSGTLALYGVVSIFPQLAHAGSMRQATWNTQAGWNQWTRNNTSSTTVPGSITLGPGGIGKFTAKANTPSDVGSPYSVWDSTLNKVVIVSGTNNKAYLYDPSADTYTTRNSLNPVNALGLGGVMAWNQSSETMYIITASNCSGTCQATVDTYHAGSDSFDNLVSIGSIDVAHAYAYWATSDNLVHIIANNLAYTYNPTNRQIASLGAVSGVVNVQVNSGAVDPATGNVYITASTGNSTSYYLYSPSTNSTTGFGSGSNFCNSGQSAFTNAYTVWSATDHLLYSVCNSSSYAELSSFSPSGAQGTVSISLGYMGKYSGGTALVINTSNNDLYNFTQGGNPMYVYSPDYQNPYATSGNASILVDAGSSTSWDVLSGTLAQVPAGNNTRLQLGVVSVAGASCSGASYSYTNPYIEGFPDSVGAFTINVSSLTGSRYLCLNLYFNTNDQTKTDVLSSLTLTYGAAVTAHTLTPSSITRGQSVSLTETVMGAASSGIINLTDNRNINRTQSSGSGANGTFTATDTPAGMGTYSYEFWACDSAGLCDDEIQSVSVLGPTPTGSASATSITTGQSITLSITTSNAGSSGIVDLTHGNTQLGGWADGNAHSVTVVPQQGTTQYRFFACSDAGASQNCSNDDHITVTASAAALSVSGFSASPSTINLGQSVSLSETIQGATSSGIINASAGYGVTGHNGNAANGTFTANDTPSQTGTISYQFWACDAQSNCINKFQSVTVNPPPATVTTHAISPTSINKGDTITLTFTVIGATSSGIINGTENRNVAGYSGSGANGNHSQTFVANTQGVNQFMFWACDDNGHCDNEFQSVTVQVPTVSLAASASSVTAGQPVVLTLTTSGDGSRGIVDHTNGDASVPGLTGQNGTYTVTVNPSTTTTYAGWACADASATQACTGFIQPVTVTVTAPSVPAAPTSLTATAQSGSEIDLSWTAPTGSITGYRVLQSSSQSGPFAQVATPTGTSQQVTGLTSSTLYYFEVVATNSGGDSLPSTSASSTTLTIPGNPVGLTATTISSTEIDLSWTAPSGNPTGYKVYGCTVSNGPCGLLGSPTQTSFNMTGLDPATTYYITVGAYNAAGYAQPGTFVQGQTFQATPAVPNGLTATAISASEIDVNWSLPSSGQPSVSQYKIFESVDNGQTYTQVATSFGVSQAITLLNSATTYLFKIAASNSAGDSAATAPVSATTLAPPTPSAPTNLTATVNSPTSIDLSWTAPSGLVNRYHIFSGSNSGLLTEVATSTIPTFQVSGLVPNTGYFFKVTAENAGGLSPTSSVATASTIISAPAAPTNLSATTTSQNQILLTWAAPTGPVTGYKVFQSVDGGINYSQISTPTPPTYLVTALLPSSFYAFKVEATNATGDSPASAPVTVTTLGPPSAPANLVATAVSPAEIDLSWSAPSEVVANYKVEVSTDGQTFSQVATPVVALYHLSALNAATAYVFRVRASNPFGDSSYSTTANATTLSAATPNITSLTVTPTTYGGSVVWTTTNATTSRLAYGVSTQYGSMTALLDLNGVTSHSVTLSGLQSCAIYHVQVLSGSAASTDQLLQTTGCPGNANTVAHNDTLISHGSGGNLQLMQNSSGLTLRVPANATSADTQYLIRQLDPVATELTTGLPGTYHLVGSYLYHLQAQPDAGTITYNFLVPLTVSMQYLPADITNFDASTLTIQRWDSGAGWTPLTGCVRDSVTQTVSCQTNGFSTFALLANTSGGVTAPNTVPSTTSVSTLPVTGSSIWLAATSLGVGGLGILLANTIAHNRGKETAPIGDPQRSLGPLAPADTSSSNDRKGHILDAIQWVPIVG